MAIVDFETGMWGKPWFQELSPTAKLLFPYLWTNTHKNVACIYTISLKTIKDETGLNDKQVTEALRSLYPKVKYDKEFHLVWVVNHVKRSYMRTENISPKIVAAIKKNLLTVPEGHSYIGEFLNKYKVLGIEYPYPIDRVPEGYPYPSSSGKGSGKGNGKGGAGEKPRSELMKRFDRFWQAYPEKKSKGQAEKVWKQIAPSEQLLETMLSTIRRAKTSVKWNPDKNSETFIPHPSTWLNARGWEDVYTPSPEIQRQFNEHKVAITKHRKDAKDGRQTLEGMAEDHPRYPEIKERAERHEAQAIVLERHLEALV